MGVYSCPGLNTSAPPTGAHPEAPTPAGQATMRTLGRQCDAERPSKGKGESGAYSPAHREHTGAHMHPSQAQGTQPRTGRHGDIQAQGTVGHRHHSPHPKPGTPTAQDTAAHASQHTGKARRKDSRQQQPSATHKPSASTQQQEDDDATKDVTQLR